MAEKQATFTLNGVTFIIETNQGFDDKMAQLKISAKIGDSKQKTIEIFEVKPVGNNMHISPDNKKVTRLLIPQNENELDLEDDDLIAGQ